MSLLLCDSFLVQARQLAAHPAPARGIIGRCLRGSLEIARWSFCFLIVSLGACSEPSRVSVFQPQLTGRERDLSLAGDKAVWAGGGGAERVLAEFPLPGASTGRPTYVMYLHLSAGAAGADDASRVARGFFVQTRGRNAGLAYFVTGKVTLVGKGAAGARTVEMDMACEDGTRVAGRVVAQRDERAVQLFEQERHAADVRLLLQPAP